MSNKYNNKTHKMVDNLRTKPFANFLLNLLLGRKVPFVRTGKVKVLEMTTDLVRVAIPNKNAVQNHIGQVHATAMLLLAETASGLVTAMNIPEKSLPLLKEMNAKYIKRSTGSLTASAQILSEQRVLFQQEKGEVTLSVEVRDENNEIPVLIQATWAWIPRK